MLFVVEVAGFEIPFVLKFLQGPLEVNRFDFTVKNTFFVSIFRVLDELPVHTLSTILTDGWSFDGFWLFAHPPLSHRVFLYFCIILVYHFFGFLFV